MKELEPKPYMRPINFARKCGVTKMAISSAIKKEKLPIIKDERTGIIYVDTVHPQAIEYATRERSNRQKTKNIPRKIPPVPVDKIEQKEIEPKKPENMSRSFGTDDAKYLDISQVGAANLVKTYETIRQARIRSAKEQGQLINREGIARLFAKLFAVDANEWKSLPGNAAPEIAAIFENEDKEKIVKAEEMLDKMVHKTLEHSQRLMEDYLTEIEVEIEGLQLDTV